MSGIILIQNPDSSTQGRTLGGEEKELIELILRRMEGFLSGQMAGRERVLLKSNISRLRKLIAIDYTSGHIPSLGELFKLNDECLMHNLRVIACVTRQETPA